VVASMLVGIGAAVVLGARALKEETITQVSYFDEAVTGLDLGSPVSFRGVTVGRVSSITVAPDRRHVAVHYALTVDELKRLGLARERGKTITIRVPPDVRVQLASTGITGVKYVKLDFFDPAKHPRPELPFAVREGYIPATASTLKNVEDTLMRAIDKMPEIIDSAGLLLAQLRAVAGQLEQENLPSKAGKALGDTERLISRLDGKVAQVDAEGLSRDARAALSRLDQALGNAQSLLAKVEGKGGLLESMERASDNLGDMAGGPGGAGEELDNTLRELGDASRSVQRLVDALEVDPDMLLKGRSR
jgi:phospholipid/cholesterol/gamma-HCH transport system substrate-binding protein